MTEVGLSVELDEMHHAMVEGIPEVAGPAALGTRHPKMMPVPSEVSQTYRANGHIVGDVVDVVGGAAVVTVGLVIAGADEVRPSGGDGFHFVVELVENTFVHFAALGDAHIGKKPLYLLFKPIVCISNITGWVGICVSDFRC